MSDDSPSFNLLDAPWIPVLYADGAWKQVGVVQALNEAHLIRQVAASNPMDRAALLRFLLSLLYWCQGNPSGNGLNGLTSGFPPEWFEKLEAERGRFDLFGETRRFCQYGNGGGASQKILAANYLIQEVPTGNNAWHFRHATDKRDGLCPSCCAKGLLRLPLFSTSGGRGKPPGINAKPPIYVFPVGQTLLQTLLISWREVSHLGTPSWVQPDIEIPLQGEVPLLTGMTWLPRRVWLDGPSLPEAPCISCGGKAPLVRTCVFDGVRSSKSDDASIRWRDPHAIYLESRSGDQMAMRARDALGSPDAASSQWASLLAGAVHGSVYWQEGFRLWIVGFASVQNDKYLEAFDVEIAACGGPADLGRHELVVEDSADSTAVLQSKLDHWISASAKMLGELKRVEAKYSRPKRKQVRLLPLLSSIRPHVESEVGMGVGEFASEEDGWIRASETYRPLMRALGATLAPGYTTRELERRNLIGEVMPPMAPKEKKKSEKKKPGRSRK